MSAFLCTCLNTLVSSTPCANRSPELVFTTAAMNSICEWMLRLEGAGRYLSKEDADWIWDEGNKFLG